MFKTKCGEWFGEQLFGEQFDGKEKNTKTEQIVWEHIKDFSLGKWIGKTIPPFVLDSFKKLMLCKFCFGDLLIPTSKILYRGLVIYNNRLWKERIIKNIEQIKNSKFIANPGWHCKFCDFKNICEFRSK